MKNVASFAQLLAANITCVHCLFVSATSSFFFDALRALNAIRFSRRKVRKLAVDAAACLALRTTNVTTPWVGVVVPTGMWHAT